MARGGRPSGNKRERERGKARKREEKEARKQERILRKEEGFEYEDLAPADPDARPIADQLPPPALGSREGRPTDRGGGGSTAKLFIGNLSNSCTEDELRQAFAADGRTVREVAIPLDRESGQPRGFGFVVMGSRADAKAAIEALDGAVLAGRPIRVDEARPR